MDVNTAEPQQLLERYYTTMRERLGERRRFERGTLLAVQIARYALAIGDENGIHRDRDAAVAAGYDDVVAPPNMLASIWEWDAGTPERDLNPDGTPAVDRGALHRGLRGFGAGESMQMLVPATAGMDIVEDEELERVELKHGRRGPVVFVTERHTFSDSRSGQVLNVNHRTFAVREPHEEQ